MNEIVEQTFLYHNKIIELWNTAILDSSPLGNKDKTCKF